MREVVIASAVRTAIGGFGGSLVPFSAVDLGIVAAKGAIARSKIPAGKIDEVVFGNILGAGLGQNIARQIAIMSGLPVEIPAMTINMLCGSGLRSVSLAYQMICSGECNIALVGGTESMSNAPYVIEKMRWGSRMGHANVMDLMLKDGLTDVFNNYHMGVTAENLARKFSITRHEQDEFAAASQAKAEAAIKAGNFKEEIVSVSIPQKKGDDLVFDTDEYPRSGVTAESLGKLKPAFARDGTVTAGNSSGINDGAAALVLMSDEAARKYDVKPLCSIVSFGSAGVEPEIMGYGVVPATEIALAKVGMGIKNIDLAELNEAFAAQAISVIRGLSISPEKVNVNGGAIALGHPIGASGARILVTLLHAMKNRSSEYGLASLCIGGGMGTSIIVKQA